MERHIANAQSNLRWGLLNNHAPVIVSAAWTLEKLNPSQANAYREIIARYWSAAMA